MRLFVLLSAVLLISSCEVKFDWSWNKNSGSADHSASGKTVTENRTIGAFEQVKLEGLGRLVFDPAIASGTLQVRADENALAKIQTTVTGKELLLKENGLHSTSLDLEFRVAPPANLSTVTLSGLGEITSDAPLKSSSPLTVNLDGLGHIDLTVDSPAVTARQSGSGQLKLAGTAARVDVNASGLGQVDVEGLKTKEAAVESSGLGEVRVFASEKLRVRANGLGAVHFAGNPKTTDVQTKGMTEVTAVE